MNMRNIGFCFFICSVACCSAHEPPLPQEPPRPYDFDLFRKDATAYFTDLEFLYWNVEEGALDYAQKMSEPYSVSPFYSTGKTESSSFDLSPGFRLALGYFNAPKYWEVRAQYTHLLTRGNNSATKPTDADLYLSATWPCQFNPTQANTSTSFAYNLFDIEIDRVFITNPHLRLKLLGSVGATWIKQQWKIQYLDSSALSPTTIRNQWHYVGAGTRLGVSVDWFWGNNMYITGSAKTALFLGHYYNGFQQTYNSSIPNRKNNFSDIRPAAALELLIGPSWQKNLRANRIEIFAGYELTTWFNLQEIRRIEASPSVSIFNSQTLLATSMLAIQGLTTRLSVTF